MYWISKHKIEFHFVYEHESTLVWELRALKNNVNWNYCIGSNKTAEVFPTAVSFTRKSFLFNAFFLFLLRTRFSLLCWILTESVCGWFFSHSSIKFLSVIFVFMRQFDVWNAIVFSFFSRLAMRYWLSTRLVRNWKINCCDTFLMLRNIQNCKFKSLNCNFYWLSLCCGESIFGKTTELAFFCRLLCIDFLIKSELHKFGGKRNDITNDDKNSIFGAEEKIISIQFDYRHVYAIQLFCELAKMRLLRFAYSLFVAEIFLRCHECEYNAVIWLNFILFCSL